MKRILNKVILIFIFAIYASSVSAKTYKIGCTDDYYPYIFTNASGEFEGLVIDIWELWSKKADFEIEFVQLDIKAGMEQIVSGEIDIIGGVFYSEERAEYLDFSEQILRMKSVLFLKNGIKPDSINTISEIVNVVENSIAHSYLQSNYPNLKLHLFKSHLSLKKAVESKRINAFVSELPNPLGNFKQQPAPAGYYKYQTLFSDKLRPAVKKGNSELLNILLAGSTKITDEEIIEIAEKWDLFKNDRTLLLWIFVIGFAFLVASVGLIIYTIKNKDKAKQIANFEGKTDWQVIINKGENDLIEFKSSLRWDYRQEKVNKALEIVIVKTISAFLNTEGGLLFIGVDDDGNTLGLENDYKSMSKNNSDGFLLTLTNLINQNLGKSTHKFIAINIISINEKDVCIVNVEKSDKPVFLGKNEKEEFYIRASASSQPMGLKEAYKYISSHWEK